MPIHSRFVAVVVVVSLFLAPVLRAAPADTDLAAAARLLDAELARQYPADQPGAAVLVVKDGQTLLRKGYGLANLELKVPIAPEMVFRLGSITKQFTAVATLMLVEEGKLTLDTPLSSVLPECPAAARDKVTIRHLLSHTSGIAGYTEKPAFFAAMGKDHSHTELLAYFAEDPLQFEPGERYAYSNSGYYLLGMVIEKVSGQTYADFVRQRIFEKLGMRHSWYDLPDILIPGRVEGYENRGDGYVPAAYLSMKAPFAAGALASSVDDLVLWDQALYGESLVKASALAEAWTPYRVSGKEPSSYGFGWVAGDYQGHKVLHHDGGINGFTTSMLRLPDDRLLVVVLSNGHTLGPDTVAQRAVMRVLGDLQKLEPITLPVDKLARFEGVYHVADQVRRVVRVRDGKLTSQRTGGPVFTLLPLTETEFLFADQNDRMRFELDDQGKARAMLMLRWGQTPERAELTGEPLPAARTAIQLKPAELDQVVGDYELAPGFVLAIRRDGDRLTAQATGQPAFELFAESATKFFLQVVDAQLIFVIEGAEPAKAVTLLQGGAMTVGKRSP